MGLIDTHTHLYAEQFDKDRDEVVQRAIDAGVEKLLLPNIDLDSLSGMFDLVDRYPGVCYAMLGLHPTDVKDGYIETLKSIEAEFDRKGVIAVGEIGVDLYWDKSTLPEQIEALKIQLEWAIDRNLPVVLHVRDSFDETFAIVEQFLDRGLRGVFHSFTGSAEQARKIINAGFLIGVNGIVTFKSGGVDKMIEQIGVDYLILETDAPYLSPVPNRGKRNESSYIVSVANRVAEVCSVPLEEVIDVTSRNSIELFGI